MTDCNLSTPEICLVSHAGSLPTEDRLPCSMVCRVRLGTKICFQKGADELDVMSEPRNNAVYEMDSSEPMDSFKEEPKKWLLQGQHGKQIPQDRQMPLNRPAPPMEN